MYFLFALLQFIGQTDSQERWDDQDNQSGLLCIPVAGHWHVFGVTTDSTAPKIVINNKKHNGTSNFSSCCQ